jgi:hypothetical protein
MSHAFTRLPAPARVPALAVLAVLTIAYSLALNAQGKPLRERVPGGIVAYELAWSAERAGEILEAWRPVREVARRQLVLDFGFLVLYPLALSLACALLSQASPGGGVAAAGAFLSRAVLLAGPLDAVENLALLRMLGAGPGDAPARLAAVCAGVKFLLVFCAFAYLLVRGAALLLARLRRA